MNQIFIPKSFTKEEIETVMKEIDDIFKKYPEAENDYILVDELEEETNIKFFDKEMTDKFLREFNREKKQNLTPDDFLMMVMRSQNTDKELLSNLYRTSPSLIKFKNGQIVN